MNMIPKPQPATKYSKDTSALLDKMMSASGLPKAEQRRLRFVRLAHRFALNQGMRLEKDEQRLTADPVLSQLRNLDVTARGERGGWREHAESHFCWRQCRTATLSLCEPL